jgi:hypothetical protein
VTSLTAELGRDVTVAEAADAVLPHLLAALSNPGVLAAEGVGHG